MFFWELPVVSSVADYRHDPAINVLSFLPEAAASSMVAFAFGPRVALPETKLTVIVLMGSKSSSPLMRLLALSAVFCALLAASAAASADDVCGTQ